MSTVFVVRNQHGYFATKQKEWECGRDSRLLFRSPHRDEALNIVFELSSRDIYLRAEAISVELDDKKQPVVEVTAPPKAKPEAVVSDEQGDDAEAIKVAVAESAEAEPATPI